MRRDARIYVAGAETLIGASLLRALDRQGYTQLLGKAGDGPTLTDAQQVEAFFANAAPEYVFLVAGKSGGIQANQRYPADLIRENLLVECHVIQSAARHGVNALLYLASSCCYPKHCPQPMQEAALLTGALEPTSEPYAIAKIAGITLCQAYRRQHRVSFLVGIPGDVFGPGDDFSLEDSHVVPALIRKMHDAKVRGDEAVVLWGTGTPRREFLYADDLAEACLFVLQHYDRPDPINLGGGSVLSIRELAELVKDVVGYAGRLQFDTSKPDGMPAKWLDATTLSGLGWRPRTSLRSALTATYAWFLQEQRTDAVVVH